MPRSQPGALHAEWRKLSPGLGSELPERETRLAWTNAELTQRRQDAKWQKPNAAADPRPGNGKW